MRAIKEEEKKANISRNLNLSTILGESRMVELRKVFFFVIKQTVGSAVKTDS